MVRPWLTVKINRVINTMWNLLVKDALYNVC